MFPKVWIINTQIEMCVCGCELERILSVPSTWTSSDRWQALKFLCAFHGNCKQTTRKSKKINKATTTTTLSDADTHEMTAKKDQNMTIKIRTLKSDRLAGRPHPHPRPRPCPRTRLRFCFCLLFFFILFFDLTLHLSLGSSRVPVLTPQVWHIILKMTSSNKKTTTTKQQAITTT